MNKNKEITVLGIGAILTAITSVIFAQNTIFSPNRALKTVILLKVFLTSLNVVLLLGLMANYLQIYSNLKTSLSRSLVVFSGALILYAITSSPLIHVLAGFEIISVGPFTFLPDVFVTIATVIILRESYR